MKWKGRRQSDNVDDRRGRSSKGTVIAGGGTIGIIILLLQLFGGETGQMIAPVLEQMNDTTVTEKSSTEDLTSEEIELGNFAKRSWLILKIFGLKSLRKIILALIQCPKWYYFLRWYILNVVALVQPPVHFIVQLTKLYTWI